MLRGFIAPFYAALLGLFFVFLALRVSKKRGEKKVAIGDGGNNELQIAIRAHGNFAEFVPIALILLFSLDLLRWKPWLVHTLGIALLSGRILHFVGLNKGVAPNPYRFSGVLLTLGMICVTSIILIFSFVSDHFIR